MARLTPVSQRQFVDRLRELGFEGPYAGGRHPQMGRGEIGSFGDIGSSGNLSDIIHQVQPDEIYHLAAQSHVRVSSTWPMRAKHRSLA